MTTYDDENLEPSEVREPSLDELLGEVLGLIDEIVAARLADGELGRRRTRIKADADRGISTLSTPDCDGGCPTPRLVGRPVAVPASGGEWPDGLHVALNPRRTLISAAERDAEEIRGAARQAAQRYQDAALKHAAETVAAAQQKAEQILAAAQQKAEQIVAATQAERDQMLATARCYTAFSVDQAQVEMPAQPARRGGISGAALVDHIGRDVVGVVSDQPNYSEKWVSEGGMRTRIFLSWCHQDMALKDALLRDLLPALGVSTDLAVEWWEDSHLSCGEEWTAGIVGRLDEADFGLLLLSTRYFGRSFIREHELPRFAGPRADKRSLPVALSPLPAFGPELTMGGVKRQLVFTRDGKSFAECSGAQRTGFANDLAAAIRRRARGLNGYRALWLPENEFLQKNRGGALVGRAVGGIAGVGAGAAALTVAAAGAAGAATVVASGAHQVGHAAAGAVLTNTACAALAGIATGGYAGAVVQSRPTSLAPTSPTPAQAHHPH